MQHSHTSVSHVQCIEMLKCLTKRMEGHLKVDAAVFDLCLAKGCVDAVEQDCSRLPLVLRFLLETNIYGIYKYTTRPWMIDYFITD